MFIAKLEFLDKHKTRNEIRPIQRIGDKEINQFIHQYFRRWSPILRSNKHFVSIMSQWSSSIRNTHNFGDMIEATYAEVENAGKHWFLYQVITHNVDLPVHSKALELGFCSIHELIDHYLDVIFVQSVIYDP